jgi:hypothetical protein
VCLIHDATYLYYPACLVLSYKLINLVEKRGVWSNEYGRYPADRYPTYKFQVKIKVEAYKSHASACPQPQHEPHSPGQLRGRHVSCGSSSRCLTRGRSGAATCPVAPAPAAQPGAAPRPPRVLRLQLPLPSLEQLRGHHVCLEGPTVYVLLK